MTKRMKLCTCGAWHVIGDEHSRCPHDRCEFVACSECVTDHIEGFHVLEKIKSKSGPYMVWLKSDGMEYTPDLRRAGVWTAREVQANPALDDGIRTRAVKCKEAIALSPGLVVPGPFAPLLGEAIQ